MGRATLRVLRGVGAFTLLGARVFRAALRLHPRQLLRALRHYGTASLPVASVTALVVGAMVVLQTALYAERFGARGLLGWAAGYAIIWEFGPLFLGLLMAARVGARHAAELATMTLHGQLEGLTAIAIDPLRVIVAPRAVALVLSVLLLTPVTLLLAVACEALAAQATLGLPPQVFFGSFADMLGWPELLGGALKSLAFGLAIAAVGTYAGLRAWGGAPGVGRAAAGSVVGSTAAIFALDFAVSAALTAMLRSGP